MHGWWFMWQQVSSPLFFLLGFLLSIQCVWLLGLEGQDVPASSLAPDLTRHHNHHFCFLISLKEAKIHPSFIHKFIFRFFLFVLYYHHLTGYSGMRHILTDASSPMLYFFGFRHVFLSQWSLAVAAIWVNIASRLLLSSNSALYSLVSPRNLLCMSIVVSLIFGAMVVMGNAFDLLPLVALSVLITC